MVLGAAMLISAIIGVYAARHIMGQNNVAPTLPDQMVLVLNIKDGLKEKHELSPFDDPFSPLEPTTKQLVEAIEKATKDNRVKALLVRFDGGPLSLAHVQEFRKALKAFNDSGKLSYIYSKSYGDAGDLNAYYLASAFKYIWMQPVGLLSITGLKAEMPFARTLLDKLGIKPEFYQREEYKTAYESLTNSEMSEANRSAIKAVIDDISKTMISDIASDKRIEKERFVKLMDDGLFTSAAAFNAGLIDWNGYADELLNHLKEQITGDAENDRANDIFIPLMAYKSNIDRKTSPDNILHANTKTKVALVHVSGMIVDSDSGASNVAAADRIAPAIWDAAQDDKIEAIIVRIDSPGGSPSASETILHALMVAQAKYGKPIIVSMGPTAASGGYWIASFADQIFASPSTLTGSIGVVGGKPSAKAMWDKIGVNWDSVGFGKNAGLNSINEPYSPSQEAQIELMLDRIYWRFIQRVSAGRNMKPAQVKEIAKGRVWTGQSALDIGLVDEIGGLSDAIQFTAQLIGAKGRDELSIIELPKARTPLELLIEFLSGQGMVWQNLQIQSTLSRVLAPIKNHLPFIFDDAHVTAYEPLRF